MTVLKKESFTATKSLKTSVGDVCMHCALNNLIQGGMIQEKSSGRILCVFKGSHVVILFVYFTPSQDLH